jgi:hypothetical protein
MAVKSSRLRQSGNVAGIGKQEVGVEFGVKRFEKQVACKKLLNSRVVTSSNVSEKYTICIFSSEDGKDEKCLPSWRSTP